jgi:ferredoxin-type protein NapF
MVSRRQFLRGKLSHRPAPIRPPWSGAEDDFLARCTRCGDCQPACPTRIITIGDGGFPEIDFRRGECTFCAACVEACQPKALAVRDADGIRQPWRLKAHISDDCFPRHGVVCHTCGDHCAPGAIRFIPQAGTVALPEVIAANCTGCGACLAPCPATAITLAAGRPTAPAAA